MSSSKGVFVDRRNARNGPTTLKRRSHDRGDFQEDRIRYAPPQKRPRSQTQTQFLPVASPGFIPMYHNMSRVSSNYYGHDVIRSNSSNSFPFDNDSLIKTNPFGYGNRNPQFVVDDDLPEWVPNRSNFPIRSSNLVTDTNRVRLTNSHSNMIPIAPQAMTQLPIVSKDLSDLLNALNSKPNPSENDESPLGLDFDMSKLNIRHESVIKSLYSDMPRQCSSCGVRFKCQEDHSNHMDWHVRKNRTVTKTNTRIASQKPKKSREWFASAALWLTGGTTGETKAYFNETRKEKEVEEERKHVVPADENQKMCALCIEPLEEFFSHEDDEWMYRDAVYLNMKELGPIVHAKCMPEQRKEPAKKTKKAIVSVPSVASALVC